MVGWLVGWLVGRLRSCVFDFGVLVAVVAAVPSKTCDAGVHIIDVGSDLHDHDVEISESVNIKPKIGQSHGISEFTLNLFLFIL